MTIRLFIVRYLPVILALGLLNLAIFIEGAPLRFSELRFTTIILAYVLFVVFLISEFMRARDGQSILPVVIISLVIATIALNLGLMNTAVFKAGNYPLKTYQNLRLERLAKGDPQRQIRFLAHTMYKMRPHLRGALIRVPQRSPIGITYWYQYARAGKVKSYRSGEAPKTIDVGTRQGERLLINKKRSLLFFSGKNAHTYVLEAIDRAKGQFRLSPAAENNR